VRNISALRVLLSLRVAQPRDRRAVELEPVGTPRAAAPNRREHAVAQPLANDLGGHAEARGNAPEREQRAAPLGCAVGL
jgi:hypothetical protein